MHERRIVYTTYTLHRRLCHAHFYQPGRPGQIADALTVSKEALTGIYWPEDDVTYVVRLTNNGTAALTDLSLTDDLGGYAFEGATLYPLAYQADSLRYFVNGAAQPAPTVTPGAPLTVSGITVPAGGNALIVYEATVTAFAPPAEDGSITNTVTATGAGLAARAHHCQGPSPGDRGRGSAGDLHLHHRE